MNSDIQRDNSALGDPGMDAAQQWSDGTTSVETVPQASTEAVGGAYSTASTGTGDTSGGGDVQSFGDSTDTGGVGTRGNAGEDPGREEGAPPHNEEHPLGIGQQCFKCGAYNDLDAKECWNCSSELSNSMVETPGLVESVPTATSDATGIGTGGVAESDATDSITDGDGSEGAQPISSS